MKNSTKILLKAGFVRAVRTFIETFVATIIGMCALQNLTWIEKLLYSLGIGIVASIGAIVLAWINGDLPEVSSEIDKAKSEEQLEVANAALDKAQEDYNDTVESVEKIILSKAKELEDTRAEAANVVEAAKQAVEDAKKSAESAEQAMNTSE